MENIDGSNEDKPFYPNTRGKEKRKKMYRIDKGFSMVCNLKNSWMSISGQLATSKLNK